MATAAGGSEGGHMIESGKLNGYLVAIKEELRKAEGKHPDFCEALLDPESRVSWADAESSIKRHNATSKEYADNVLMEEMAEACAAISAGDKAYTQQLEGEVGKWHHAYDALMVERYQLVSRITTTTTRFSPTA